MVRRYFFKGIYRNFLNLSDLLMDILLIVLVVICFLGSLLGCVLPVLPGPPLSYIGILILYFGNIVEYSLTALITWAVITVAVTVIDFLLTPYMTKRFGGSKAGTYGAMIGLVIGLFLPWPFGPLITPFACAFLGEIIVSKRKSEDALKSALGTFLSFFVGTGIKLIACIGMILSVFF